MKTIHTICLILMGTYVAVGQSILGETTVEVGDTQTYTFNDQGEYGNTPWEVTGATSHPRGTGPYYNDVVFDQGNGTATVTFTYGTNATVSLEVTVNATPPATPSATFTTVYNCGSTVISHPGVATDVNFQWWWQTESNGTSTSLGNSSSITRTSSSDLFLRARLKVPPYTWSSGSFSTNGVTVNFTPPATPSVANHASRFEPGALTISTAPVSGTYEYRWYAGPVGGVKIFSGPSAYSYTINNVPSSTTYFVSTWNGCESGRLGVNVTIYPLPTIQTTTSSGRSINMGEKVVLGTTSSYDSYTWKNAAGTTVGTAATDTTSSTGVFTVVVTKTGASNSGTSLPFEVFSGLNGQNINYITTNAIQIPNITSTSGIAAMSVNQNAQTIQYVDGLGRPVQSVVTQGSPLKRDIIQPVVYDDLGREYRKYLPASPNRKNGWFIRGVVDASGNLAGPAENFYDNPTDNIADDAAPYAETIFERSPLNRPLKNGSPGTAWQPNSDPEEMNDKVIKNSYETNLFGHILNLVFNPATGALSCGLGSSSHYATGSLSVTRVTDEESHEVVEYKNKKGQVICKEVEYATVSSVKKYAKTYYVYDDLGNLVLVLQPEALKLLEGN